MNPATPNNQGEGTILLKVSPKMTNCNFQPEKTNPNLKTKTNMHKSTNPFNNLRSKLNNLQMKRKK